MFIKRGLEAHRGVGRVSEKADHLGVRGGADEGHVAVSEGAVDLQVETRLGGGISVLSEGLHSVRRQVEVEAVGTDLRSGNLKSKEEEETLDQIISDVIEYIRGPATRPVSYLISSFGR